MSNYVDLHHHLVYGVDDGAQTLQDMQMMIRRAAGEGVRDIVCTSHAVPGLEPFPMEKYLAHLEEARQFIQSEGIDLTLHPGCEVLYTDAAARLLREGRIPTLADSDVVLVEFSPDASFRDLTEAAKRFGVAGYDVLFAHVERYDTLHDMKHVQALREDYGVLMQMNANTILAKHGFFHGRWIRRLLEGGAIDCIATDAHNMTYRPCRMQECHTVLKERYGQERADELCGGFQRRLLGLKITHREKSRRS